MIAMNLIFTISRDVAGCNSGHLRGLDGHG
jgi:hypothetical protein